MKKVFMIIFSLFLILQSVQGFDFEEWELESEDGYRTLYERWRTHYVVERLPEEMEARINVFKENVMYVLKNMEPPYNHKLNKFADWTLEEFSYTYLECLTDDDSEELEGVPRQVMHENASQPPIKYQVDWREEGAVTPVKDQKLCCSCWAFSTVAAVEGVNKINGGKLISLSEQELVDCTSTGCNRGTLRSAFDFILANSGITTEKDYPYHAVKNDCTAPKKDNVMISGFKLAEQNNEKTLAVNVARQPISVLVDVKNMLLMLYTGGVFKGPCETNLNHAMTVVGYGSEPDDGTKFWIVKNSFGDMWGEKGYIRIKKDIDDPKGLCGIAMFPYYPTQNGNNIDAKDEL